MDKVIKRNDVEQDFCLDKIVKAIKAANESVEKENQMDETSIQKVVNTVMKKLDGFTSINVEDIQDIVEQALVRHNKYAVSKAYILFRQKKKENKKFNEIEEKALSLINGTSDLRGDNANKHIDDNGATRDYLAGIVCKSVFEKTVSKDVVKAHKKGLIHFHDTDYSPAQKMHNCFSGSQKFITQDGIRKFSDYIDGDVVYVKDKDGITRKATVHTYGRQDLNEITLTLRNGIERIVYATSNHTWILQDGRRTENLCVGDKLLPNNVYNNNTPIDVFSMGEEDAKYWCLGFAIGDGYDHMCDKTLRWEVRLCGNKNRYIDIFKKAGIFRIKETKEGDFKPYVKNLSKQEFLNSKIWRYLTPNQKSLLFLGYYAADGMNGQSSIATSDERVLMMIQECSGMANYFITRITNAVRDTNFKKNSYITYVYFLQPQKINYGWIVKSIKPCAKKDSIVYCVIEPETHTFTLENGIITGNCDILNIEDQFKNSFQMQSTLIEPNEETPFRTACNLLAQIHLIVSGRQYGGQTISWSHLLPFIDRSRKLFRKEIIEDFAEEGITLSEESLSKKVEKKLRNDIYEGVKTYQYQILCHSSSNGQTPFVSNNLCLREAQTQQELDDFAILIEEIFNRRIKGVKDESGHYISPLFPKLLYWTCDGLNVKKGDPYFYLTELAAKCEVKRMQPDIVSERETRKVKQGQIIPSMGCRSLLAPIWEENTYPVNTEFYWTTDTFSDGISYPYGTFVPKGTFEEVANGEYTKGDYQINFRGNTGWLIKKTDDAVTILEPKVYGRWNNGVVTINLPHVALESLSEESLELLISGDIDAFQKTVDMNKFYSILDERLELCRKGLQERYKACCSIKGKNSPILWQYGALARIGAEDTVGDLMKKYPQRASISLGYVGLFETCVALLGESNTTDKGRKLSKEILTYLNKKCDEWREVDHMNYSIYGTPEESLTYKFALANRKDFGVIPRITDKDYVVNSYHVDPREHIDAFKKIEIEGEYLSLSSGGAVSYIETPDISNNIDAVISIIQWMHTHIVYAEINRKIGVCYECGYEGDIPLTKTEDGRFEFTCPNCGNKDDNKMHVMARLCGYLGTVNAGNTNKGRLDDIYHRTVHLDNFDEN